MDEGVAAVARRARATRTAPPPRFARATSRRARRGSSLAEPAWLRRRRDARLLELPTTHSLGMAARAARRALCPATCTSTSTTPTCSTTRRRRALAIALAAARPPPRAADLLRAHGRRPSSTSESCAPMRPSNMNPPVATKEASAVAPRAATLCPRRHPAQPAVPAHPAARFAASCSGLSSVCSLVVLDLRRGRLRALRRRSRCARSTTGTRRSSGACSGTRRASGSRSSRSSPCSSSGRRASTRSASAAPGFGRIVSSLVIVALLVLAFGLGTGHDFGTFGLIPTALVITAVLDGVLRASYESISREVLHAARCAPAGDRRRRGRAPRPPAADARLRARRDRLRVRRRRQRASPTTELELPLLGRFDDLRAVLAEHPTDELIVTDSDYSERELLQIVEHAHRSGVKVRVAPKTTELLVQRGGVRAGPGAAAVRAAAAGLRRHRLGGQAGVRPRRQRRSSSSSGCRSGSRSPPRSSSSSRGPGLLPRPAHRARRARRSAMFKFRTMYADAAERAGRARAARTRRTERCSRSATTRA